MYPVCMDQLLLFLAIFSGLQYEKKWITVNISLSRNSGQTHVMFLTYIYLINKTKIKLKKKIKKDDELLNPVICNAHRGMVQKICQT